MACDACINVSAGEESDDKVMQYGYAMKVLIILGSARFCMLVQEQEPYDVARRFRPQSRFIVD